MKKIIFGSQISLSMVKKGDRFIECDNGKTALVEALEDCRTTPVEFFGKEQHQVRVRVLCAFPEISEREFEMVATKGSPYSSMFFKEGTENETESDPRH